MISNSARFFLTHCIQTVNTFPQNWIVFLCSYAISTSSIEHVWNVNLQVTILNTASLVGLLAHGKHTSNLFSQYSIYRFSESLTGNTFTSGEWYYTHTGIGLEIGDLRDWKQVTCPRFTHMVKTLHYVTNYMSGDICYSRLGENTVNTLWYWIMMTILIDFLN